MEILSVNLKNFKGHSDRKFFFQSGTNAICGENGAGKTSILEAIAWALFNYRGAYKNEDLIRNGASSAQAIVSFISSRDGRTYEVQRCTSKGYSLHDPQLGNKLDLKHIEQEILPWLRQQLGVAPGTDLAKLFANTIGVPQGTFTADFLQPPEKRKPIFDAILKVEEYRQANHQMLSLEKYSKAETDQLEQSIAHYDDALQDWQPLQQRQQTLSEEIALGEAKLQQLQTELDRLQTEKDQLTAQAQQVQQLASRLQQVSAQMEGKRQTNTFLEQAVQRSKQAVEICTAHRDSYQAYLRTEEVIQDLNQQMKQRQKLLKQREAQQTLLMQRQAELTRLTVKLERLTDAAAAIDQLQPAIVQQQQLEQEQTTIVDQLNQIQAFKLEQQNLSKQLSKLQNDLKRLVAEIDQLRSLESQIKHISELEQKRDRLQEQLSHVEAARQFEAELRQLVSDGEGKRDRHQAEAEQALATLRDMQSTMPLLANASIESVLQAIAAGVALNTDLLNALWRILADLSEQVSVPKLQQQLLQIKTKLDEAYKNQAACSTLDHKLVQQDQLQEDWQQLQQRLTELKTQLATEVEWQRQRQAIVAALNQLGDPRGQAQLLQRELQQHDTLSAQQTALQTQFAEIQQTIATLDENLATFAALENQIDAQKQQGQAYKADYEIYVQHRNDANQLKPLEANWHQAIAELADLEQQRTQTQDAYDRVTETYNPQKVEQIEQQYNTTRSEADRLSGSLPQQRKLLTELNTRLLSLQGISEKRDRTQAELTQKRKSHRFIKFAREVYKRAAPRITERYVQAISYEADRLFRELLNRQNIALEWTSEYEILVQEGGNNRRFLNLSGGEQMCAALALRLALLRVLADIDVAFFDEPTTNMDRPRRESLAEAIANIKSFRQLFVISHDDTFEKVTENVIVVERELV